MQAPKVLASLIRRTVHGPMWHGPALVEVLDGLGAADAARHPVPGAHSVWELVLHTAAWAEIAHDRLRGTARVDLKDDENFPPVPRADEASWSRARQGLIDAYESLAADVRVLTPERLAEPVMGHEYTVETMLHGVVEHGTWHGGQMMLLKRALSNGKAP